MRYDLRHSLDAPMHTHTQTCSLPRLLDLDQIQRYRLDYDYRYYHYAIIFRSPVTEANFVTEKSLMTRAVS